MKSNLLIDKSKQRSAEWFAARCGKCTASRFKDVMTKPRSKSADWSQTSISYANQLCSEIIRDKVKPELTGVRALEHGREHEDTAKRHYSFINDAEINEMGFIEDPSIPGVGCSLDASVTEDLILEIKCPFNEDIHFDHLNSDDWAKDHHWQVQGQMWLTGAKECDLMSFDPRWDFAFQAAIVRVTRDEDAIFDLSKRVELFLELVNSKVRRVRERYPSS